MRTFLEGGRGEHKKSRSNPIEEQRMELEEFMSYQVRPDNVEVINGVYRVPRV